MQCRYVHGDDLIPYCSRPVGRFSAMQQRKRVSSPAAAAKMPDIARFSWICCNCYLSGRLLDTNAFSARETLAVKKPIETARRKPTRGSANSIQFSTLEKGQIWKTGETYVLITDAGKRLVHYRIAKTLQQRGLRIHMASIVTVQAFLKSNRAELLVKS